MLVISCHADTGFQAHSLTHRADGIIQGHLDNFAGVQAVMQAYFSGRLAGGHVRIELTYGEETDFAGAYDVLETLSPDDTVLVVDVSGAETDNDFTIEKCKAAAMRAFVREALGGLAYDLYEGCPDPLSDVDEVEVYKQVCPRICFVGVPVFGGDYNAGQVLCRPQSIASVTEALCRLAEAYQRAKP
ncbi:MAG: hypothetical protein IT317_07545 [Anaerolineales bacterium]|nr:hypothetical protein [Anaerolineales bacterium]